ncbi:glycoside hydrolase family 3 protein [Saccharicrinis aurantiacus]|uniref:glycoside hydrolase family 3 protein n=1 Tax=Saccharicrinis aurantiacus TaxID=1849719 RepID=UPI0024924434|nr:glycoside hydrolase family 3 N-terminal domain-containing protein [Saccharicrinis aurantiacus]
MKNTINMRYIFILAACISFLLQSCDKYEYPFRNPDLPLEERLDDIIGRLTLQEKAILMIDMTQNIDRLGIPSWPRGEALHGLAYPRENNATVFPINIGMASSFNPALVEQAAHSMAIEARAQYHGGPTLPGFNVSGPLTFYSPDLNIARDPRWGRTQETFGEDPFLVSRMGVGFIKGLQGYDENYLMTVATPKHYIANNKEVGRFSLNAEIPEKSLREYYMPAFKAAIVEANAQSIMSSYNAINGDPGCANPFLLKDVLRGEWGFDGYTVSDGDGVRLLNKGTIVMDSEGHELTNTFEEAVALALKSGTDMELGPIYRDHIPAALEQGLITEELIDERLRNILRVRFKTGQFDPVERIPFANIPFEKMCSPEHAELSGKLERESYVLLENKTLANGKKLLPLNKDDIKSIAVVGPHATDTYHGIYSGTPKRAYSVLEGIELMCGDDITVNHIPWEKSEKGTILGVQHTVTRGADGLAGWDAEYFNNSNLEGTPLKVKKDKEISFNWGGYSPFDGMPYDHFSVRWTASIVPPKSGNYTFTTVSDDGVRMYINGKMIIDDWNSHGAKANSYKVNLDATKKYEVVVEYFDGTGDAEISLFWDYEGRETSNDSETVAAAKSDIVIASLGLNYEHEHEHHTDREFAGIPANQLEILKEIAKVNSNIIVILQNGSPVAVNWIKENIPAVIETWYRGQEGGLAVADMLFGKYNPGGKLPITFVKSFDDLPSIDDYDVSNGRTYMYSKKEALYPFGYGLSYTKFNFSNIRISKDSFNTEEDVEVTFTIENVGDYDGDEVVQLYVRESKHNKDQPKRRLRAFKRLNLKKGESLTETLKFNTKDLGYWNVDKQMFEVNKNSYVLEIGTSSVDFEGALNFVIK